jgi:hypothetical protein
LATGSKGQPKAVMFPTDAKLLNRARERLVRLAQKLGVRLRQSYRRVGKLAAWPPSFMCTCSTRMI